MRVLVLALAVAFVAANQGNHVPQFAPGQTYIYKYEAILMGGLPEQGLARAGVKVTSKVFIRAVDANNIILKLENPQLFEYSGIWPNATFTPSIKLTSALSDQLLTPVKFEYANGVVGKVFAPDSVSTNVLNIQRGIINVFQMNVKKTQNVYELQELGTQGVCRTHYNIREDTKTERIYLTKTKDLNQCQEKIVKDMGLSYTEKCVECETRGNALKGAAAFNYVLKPEANSARILQASVIELIQFSPLNIMNGAAQMDSRQNLTFVEQNNTPVQPISAEYLQRGSLQYEFGSELFQMPVNILKKEETQIEVLLNHLVTANKDQVHEEAPLKYIQLIQLLREAKFEKIQALWTQFKDTEDHRHWLMNAIPTIRSHVALKFLKEKFDAGELTVPEVAQALLFSLQLVKADPEAIRLSHEIFMDPIFSEQPVLREIARLGFGSLVAKFCVEIPSCPADIVRPVHDNLAQALEKGQIEEVIAYLKVLGNAAHPASRKPIQKLLPTFGSAASSLPHRVHIEALLALRNIAKKEPKMVQETAIQLFMDRNLDPELRMVSAMVLFETKLPTGLVFSIANAILKERNLQISSFVYSYMKSMTKSTAPDFASVAAAANVAIRILSPRLDRVSYRYSRSLYFDTYSNPWMVGAAASAHYINDVASILPKTYVAKARAYLAGAFADVFELGVRTEGVQEAVLKTQDIPANEQRLTKMKTVMRALSSLKTQSSSQPLGSVYVKIFGQEIAFVNIDKDMVAKIIELGKKLPAQVNPKAILDALDSGFKLHYAQPLLLSEIRRILPTAVGLPMELSLYTAAVATASVELRATVSPPPTEPFQAAQLLKSDISMRAALTPSISSHTYAVMGVNTAFIRAAVMSRARVHTIVPEKIEASIDMVKGNFKLKMLPVQGINKIVSAEIETLAAVRSMEDAKITPLIPREQEPRAAFNSKIPQVLHSAEKLPMSSEILGLGSTMTSAMLESHEILPSGGPEKDIIKPPKTFVKKMCAETETFGVKICSEVQILNASYISVFPIYAFMGRHAAEVTVSPAAGPAIERIEVEVQIGERASDKILKVIKISEEEEILEDKNVLMKLKKILIPGLKNSTTSSSSSSSQSTSSKRSSYSLSSSSRSSSSSSSRRASKMINLGRADSRLSKSNSSSSSSSSHHSSSSSSRSSLLSSSRSSSSSSSRSSRRSSLSKQELYTMKFIKNHIHQHAVSAGRPDSKSSAYSFESIYNKAKYLANSVAPFVTILVRGVRVDHKVQGYQITAYVDKATNRVQIIFADLAPENHWRICTDGVMLSNHKLMAKIAWGLECKQYKTEILAETGLVDQKPAFRVKLSWERLSKRMQHDIKKFSKYISHMVARSGLKMAKIKDVPNQLKLTVVVANETSLNVVLQTSKMAVYKIGMGLPVSLPIGNTAVELETYEDNWGGKLSHLLTKASAVECTLVNDTVTSFNGKTFHNQFPHLCSQALAQDCTDDMKFMIQLRRDLTQAASVIVVNIGQFEAYFYQRNNDIVAEVNKEVIQSFPYKDPQVTIVIRQKDGGLSLSARSYGLQELFVFKTGVKVQIVEWMKGKTCGLCGRANGEIKQEYTRPDRRVSKDPVSFAHSWVLGGESCRDDSQCLMRLESVKLEKQVNLHGQESKCYSVEPVLRCLPGCNAVRTTNVNVGFHCVPADSYFNRADGLSSIREKSIDLMETAEAHLACRCTAQCA